MGNLLLSSPVKKKIIKMLHYVYNFALSVSYKKNIYMYIKYPTYEGKSQPLRGLIPACLTF